MGQNPLRNLGTKDLIKFLEYHGCKITNPTATGDDKVLAHPKNINAGLRITLNRKDGTPIRTICNIRNWSVKLGICTRKDWSDWFGKKRNIKKGKK